MENKSLDPKDLETDLGDDIVDLEHTIFVFNGKSIQGKSLAILLGLTDSQKTDNNKSATQN